MLRTLKLRTLKLLFHQLWADAQSLGRFHDGLLRCNVARGNAFDIGIDDPKYDDTASYGLAAGTLPMVRMMRLLRHRCVLACTQICCTCALSA